jgi:acetyl-CoA carboxylase/biotin carboxylase 1
MEAKGCAKPAVWKEARRHFYWAVRARIAKSAALSDLKEASPESNHEYRLRLLNNLAGIESDATNRDISEALERLDLSGTVSQLKADHLIRQMIDLTKEDPKAAMASLARLADNLSDEERHALVGVLQSAPRSPGMLLYSFALNFG